MKNFLLQFLFCLFSATLFGQSSFSYRYDLLTDSLGSCETQIRRFSDGSLIGINQTAQQDKFYLFRLDSDGVMLWHKQIDLGFEATTAMSLCITNDSAVVVGFFSLTPSNSYLLKADINGNILWAKEFWVFAFPYHLVPYGAGGVLGEGTSKLIFIDNTGNVEHAYSLTGTGTFATEGLSGEWAGIYKLFYKKYSTGNGFDPGLLDFDVQGNVQNAYTFPQPIDTFNLSPSSPSSVMISEGGYTTIVLEKARHVGSAMSKTWVGYFAHLNALLWYTDVYHANSPNLIHRGTNGTFLFGAKDDQTGLPYIFNLDYWTGNLFSSVIPGSLASSFEYEKVSSLIRGNNGFYLTLKQSGMTILKTDTSISTLCATTATSDSTSGGNFLTDNAETITLTPIPSIVSNNLTLSVTDVPLIRYDACTGTAIDTLNSVSEPFDDTFMEVYPSITDGIIHINFKSEVSELNISLLSADSRCVLLERLSHTGSAELFCKNIPSGSYVLSIIADRHLMNRKIVIQHN